MISATQNVPAVDTLRAWRNLSLTTVNEALRRGLFVGRRQAETTFDFKLREGQIAVASLRRFDGQFLIRTNVFDVSSLAWTLELPTSHAYRPIATSTCCFDAVRNRWLCTGCEECQLNCEPRYLWGLAALQVRPQGYPDLPLGPESRQA
jgi:hypothetical protein